MITGLHPVLLSIKYSMRIYKHIDIDYHFVGEKILSFSGYIATSFIKSSDQFAIYIPNSHRSLS